MYPAAVMVKLNIKLTGHPSFFLCSNSEMDGTLDSTIKMEAES
jgi:hypothetical protein